MASPLFDFSLPALDREASVVAEGNVVVSGPVPGDSFRRSGLRIRGAPACIEPRHVDEGTCAVVVAASDAQAAIRRADALREWAHESVLPLIAVVDAVQDAEDPMLWERALTCAQPRELGRVCRLLGALGLSREGVPCDDDVEETWRLRQQLRTLGGVGVGLDAFVSGGTAFVGGSLLPSTSLTGLVRGLRLSARTRLNTDAIRVATKPN